MFGTVASFREATFRGEVLLFNTTLPDTLDFRYVKHIAQDIDFNIAEAPRTNGKCEIALLGSDLRKIRINMEIFHLYFPDSMTFDQRGSVYLTVLNKLKDEGLMESYNALDVEYQDSVYQNGGRIRRNLVGPFLKAWSYYGHEKWFIFPWTIGLFTVFSVLTGLRYGRLYDVYPIDSIGRFGAEGMRQCKKKLIQIVQAVAYTAIIFFGLKLRFENFKGGAVWQHPLLFFYLIIVYVVGLICLGFIVNLVLGR